MKFRTHYIVVFALCSGFVAVGASLCRADTVALQGYERTTASLTDRFIVHVPDRVTEMAVHIPIPDLQGTRSDDSTQTLSVGDLSIASTRQPNAIHVERDSDGIVYKVLDFQHPSAGDLTVEAQFKDLSISTQMTGRVPANRLPLAGIPASIEPFLRPSPLVQSNYPEIVDLAHEIASGSRTEFDASTRIAEWLRTNLRYGGYTGAEFNDAISTLSNRGAICEGWAHLFIALARADGIPARYVGGYTLGGKIAYPLDGSGNSTMTVVTQALPHGWVELWYPGAGWLPYEPQVSVGFVDSHHVRVWTGVDADAAGALLTWRSPPGERLSLAEQAAQSDVSDTVTLRYKGSLPGDGPDILLTR
jgi:transglutaminase-like putative cysteine protease